MLHRILPAVDDNYYFRRGTAISRAKFVSIVDIVVESGLPVICSSASSEQRGVCFSFDDGYADNDWALRQLHNRGWPAVVFPVRDYTHDGFAVMDDLAAHSAGGLCSKSAHFSDRLRGVCRLMTAKQYRQCRAKLFSVDQDKCPPDLFFTEEDLAAWSKRGIQLGIHGVTHRIWSNLSSAQLAEEVEQSTRWIESLTGKIPECAAFPHGKEPPPILSRSILRGKILYGVDRPYADQQVLRRMWLKEDTDFRSVVRSYANCPGREWS
jgi:peptidoglycan/xylan/chitin deacetylase (PgdA/CDA1 family)